MAQLTTEQLNDIGRNSCLPRRPSATTGMRTTPRFRTRTNKSWTRCMKTCWAMPYELAFTTAMANIGDAQTALGQIKHITATINKNLTT